MKIDCPHCGVHGSVDDSLAGKKLRCPECSKVFLVTEDTLPITDTDDGAMVRQEILTPEDPADAGEELSEEIAEEPEDLSDDTDDSVADCSVCNQSFSVDFLIEIDSQLYCALCKPDSEEEADEEVLDLVEEDDLLDGEEAQEEELLDIMEEDFYGDDDEDGLATADSDVALMDDEPDSEEDEENLLLMDEEDDESDGEEPEFEICSGCGESLHPDFLETVGTDRFCALCSPEESDDDSVDEEFTPEVPEDDDASDSLKELCSVCGEEFYRDFMQEVDSRLYCGVCQPEVIEVLTDDEQDLPVPVSDSDDTDPEPEEDQGSGPDFTVGDLIREAWQKTSGAKGAVWGGMIVMYGLIFGISFGGIAAFQGFYKGSDPAMLMGGSAAVQLVTSWLSMLMTGGIMLIGVRRALGQRVSWKMVFAGFSKALSITIAIVLQSILVMIGFLLLVLPGIYLSVGYALSLPLILDKGMGPWQALEASRKAIHKKWWTVFGMYLVMMLIYLVSAIPFGIGLIWTIPMFFVAIGVLYVRCFGHGEELEEDMEECDGEDTAENEMDDVSREAEQV